MFGEKRAPALPDQVVVVRRQGQDLLDMEFLCLRVSPLYLEFRTSLTFNLVSAEEVAGLVVGGWVPGELPGAGADLGVLTVAPLVPIVDQRAVAATTTVGASGVPTGVLAGALDGVAEAAVAVAVVEKGAAVESVAAETRVNLALAQALKMPLITTMSSSLAYSPAPGPAKYPPSHHAPAQTSKLQTLLLPRYTRRAQPNTLPLTSSRPTS